MTGGPPPDHRAALALLFDGSFVLDAETVRGLVAAFDAEMAEATVELLGEGPEGPSAFVVRFGDHAVRVRGVEGPLPEPLLEPCIQLAHYDAELKDRARGHRAILVCEHLGPSDPPLVAHVAVAAVAGALAELGAVAIVNFTARTSVPAALLRKATARMIERLGALPPPLLYAGFAKYVVEGVEGVWMRTHGAFALGLPNLAHHARGHEEGQATFSLFSDMMLYLLESRAEMAPGDVARIGEDRFTVLRAPRPDEAFLLDEGPALVVEVLDERELSLLGAPAGSA